MDVELAEAARMMGVSAVGARQLAREGRLRARDAPSVLAGDLADHDGPRELARARGLIADWAASRTGAVA